MSHKPPEFDYAGALDAAERTITRYRSVCMELQALADEHAIRLDGLIRENGEPINPTEVEIAWREKWARDIHVILQRVNKYHDTQS